MKFNTSKILQKVANRKTRQKDRIFDFLKKVEICDDLLSHIMKYKSFTKPMVNEAKKQYISSLITALEVAFFDLAVSLIDEDKLFPKKEKIEITAEEFEEIRKHKITLGFILASKVNFQNLSSIGDFFSSLLGINFFTEYKKYIVSKHCVLAGYKIGSDYYQQISDIIELRHNFIHDINWKKNISAEQISHYTNILIQYVLTASNLITFLLDIKEMRCPFAEIDGSLDYCKFYSKKNQKHHCSSINRYVDCDDSIISKFYIEL